MVLRVPQAPSPARAAVRALLAATGPRVLPGVSGVEPPVAVQPHATYEIDLSDLVAGRGVAAARFTGWRWLLRVSGTVVGAVEVGPGSAGARITEGPFTASTAAALAVAGSAPMVEHGTYEPRLLHVPGLYMVALWLTAGGGHGDVLVPLAPAPPGVRALHPCPAATLADVLGGRARQHLAAVAAES